MARLLVTMETMHAAGRRTLPPVPRAAADTAMAAVAHPPAAGETGAVAQPPAAGETGAVAQPPAAGETGAVAQPLAEMATAADVPASPRATALDLAARIDAGQEFVARLRAAAPAFAAAADAESAVVREVVPPARHRRSLCRVVLRQADGSEADLTFVGGRRQPGTGGQDGLDDTITEWLAAGQPRDTAWLIADPDASDGVAVDLTAWVPDA